MNKFKLITGILAFGSIWGFCESFIGPVISDAGLPSGAIMTGIFAITFLILSRVTFKQPGMQIGMSIVAGSLKLFNPLVTGCHLCSGIAIIAEGLVFEAIWLFVPLDLKKLKPINLQISLGIISAYFVFVVGYVVTQILTPVVQGLGFYLEDLVVFLPRILASGLLPALMGAVAVPVVISSAKMDIQLRDTLYYPITIGISLFCWFFVVGTWLLV